VDAELAQHFDEVNACGRELRIGEIQPGGIEERLAQIERKSSQVSDSRQVVNG
jgi:hypothetical protein